jgi:hypothetical protein
MEVDARRLFLRDGCSSLFTWCTQVLHFSEHAAYGRIEAARAARRFPVILDALADGRLTLTPVCLLAPHLRADNVDSVLTSAHYSTKRQLEEIVAAVRPLPAVPTSVRKLPEPGGARVVPPPAAVCTGAEGGSERSVCTVDRQLSQDGADVRGSREGRVSGDLSAAQVAMPRRLLR